MMMIAGMDDKVGDENLKEEIMRYVSNAPTPIQAIGMLGGIRERQNEQAWLYAARYEFLHNRANQIALDKQSQMNEMIHYVSTMLSHLQKKMLKKLSSYHRLKTLQEAMDVTMVFEMEHQISQHEQDLAGMETCYEEPILEETNTTEKVQMRSQVQQGQNHQES